MYFTPLATSLKNGEGSHIQLQNGLAVGALGDVGVNGMIRQIRRQ